MERSVVKERFKVEQLLMEDDEAHGCDSNDEDSEKGLMSACIDRVLNNNFSNIEKIFSLFCGAFIGISIFAAVCFAMQWQHGFRGFTLRLGAWNIYTYGHIHELLLLSE